LDNFNTTANRLLDLAIVEAKRSLSSTNEEIHPIYFGASALEYGCTLDAVTQLVPRLQDKSHALILLIQADQYGIAHSPFAPATSIIGGRHKRYASTRQMRIEGGASIRSGTNSTGMDFNPMIIIE